MGGRDGARRRRTHHRLGLGVLARLRCAGARLDLEHDEYDAHALLMQDYAIRERLEAILENVTSVFMGDFDRNLDSFRLARALAYANRRLNDEITLIMDEQVTTDNFFDVYAKYFPEE